MGLFSLSRTYFSLLLFFFSTNGEISGREKKKHILYRFGFSHADLLCEN